jgi:hypothetical protein
MTRAIALSMGVAVTRCFVGRAASLQAGGHGAGGVESLPGNGLLLRFPALGVRSVGRLHRRNGRLRLLVENAMTLTR